jgi:regulator of extracellular matrix RemA (YlzA/DUF370 family)
MMISIGDKHFIESEYIVEILKASDTRADSIKHLAAEGGRLINAAGGRRIRSVIKLKSKHIVLSALKAETLRSRLGNVILPAAPGDNDIFGQKHLTRDAAKLKPSESNDQRIEPDRRRFSYTHHIPERRSGVERINKYC